MFLLLYGSVAKCVQIGLVQVKFRRGGVWRRVRQKFSSFIEQIIEQIIGSIIGRMLRAIVRVFDAIVDGIF